MRATVKVMRHNISVQAYAQMLILLEQQYGKLSVIPTRADFDATIQQANHHQHVVIESETDRIIGMALLVISKKYARTVAHIEEDIVLDGPEMERVRKLLMDNVLKHADNLGAAVVDLETTSDRTADLKAYEDLGAGQRCGMVVYRWRL